MTARPWQRDERIVRAAMVELEARLKHYPGMVEREEITRTAACDDLDAWRAIVALFDAGTIEGDTTWTDLGCAIRRARRQREAACDTRPANDYLETRRAYVDVIGAAIARSAAAAPPAHIIWPEQLRVAITTPCSPRSVKWRSARA